MLAPLGVLLHWDFTEGQMHRLTARLLLLFALAGTFVPLALAATAAPAHACCRRKAAHPCHDSAGAESEQLAIRGTGCCSHDCCRAVTTSQWASPQPGMTADLIRNVDAQVTESDPRTPVTILS